MLVSRRRNQLMKPILAPALKGRQHREHRQRLLSVREPVSGSRARLMELGWAMEMAMGWRVDL